MKYFMVEGIIRAAENMDDAIMEQHMAYTQKAMDQGNVLISGLKTDMSGGVFIIRADTAEQAEAYRDNEPLKLHGIQDYRWVEFEPHYINPSAGTWME